MKRRTWQVIHSAPFRMFLGPDAAPHSNGQLWSMGCFANFAATVSAGLYFTIICRWALFAVRWVSFFLWHELIPKVYCTHLHSIGSFRFSLGGLGRLLVMVFLIFLSDLGPSLTDMSPAIPMLSLSANRIPGVSVKKHSVPWGSLSKTFNHPSTMEDFRYYLHL